MVQWNSTSRNVGITLVVWGICYCFSMTFLMYHTKSIYDKLVSLLKDLMGSSPRHQPAHHRPIDVYQGQEDIRHPSVELGGLGPRDQIHAPVRQG